MFCHECYIKVFFKFYGTKVNFKYSFSFDKVGKFNMDLTVKTAGTHQSSVEYICPVCCSKYNHSHICTETIHLSKKLVKSIFSLII